MAIRPIYYCDVDTTKKLLELGWCYTTEKTLVHYTEDYVYDNDPEHFESHKAGEVRTYNFCWIYNSEKDSLSSNRYPLISIEDAKWFLWNHCGIFIKDTIFIKLVKQLYYKYELQYISNDYLQTVENHKAFISYEDCIHNAISAAYELIQKLKN